MTAGHCWAGWWNIKFRGLSRVRSVQSVAPPRLQSNFVICPTTTGTWSRKYYILSTSNYLLHFIDSTLYFTTSRTYSWQLHACTTTVPPVPVPVPVHSWSAISACRKVTDWLTHKISQDHYQHPIGSLLSALLCSPSSLASELWEALRLYFNLVAKHHQTELQT